jgi:hypothetical protein
MKYYVYKHVRLKDNTTFYIGKGKGDRFKSHTARNTYWNNIVKKDGGFNTIIVKDNLTEEEAFEFEKQLIFEIGLNNLTNLTEGGTGGNTRKGFSEEEYNAWLKNRSQIRMGKIGAWSGKTREDHSIKIKEKHADGRYSYDWLKAPKSEEHKKKLSEAAKNRIRPLLTCDKCGKQMVTNLSRHKNGKNCKSK